MPPKVGKGDEEEDWYGILGCSVEDSNERIAKAARKLALKYHPDKNPDPKAEALFLAVQRAKEFLLDEKKRKEYDETLRAALKRKTYDADRLSSMDSKRRKMKEDLEARICGKKSTPATGTSAKAAAPSSSASSFGATDHDIDRIRRENAEFQQRFADDMTTKENERRRRERTEERATERAAAAALGARQVKVKWRRSSKIQSEGSLLTLFKRFGEVESTALLGSKGNSGLVTFTAEESAALASEAWSGSDDMRVTRVSDSSATKARAAVFTHDYAGARQASSEAETFSKDGSSGSSSMIAREIRRQELLEQLTAEERQNGHTSGHAEGQNEQRKQKQKQKEKQKENQKDKGQERYDSRPYVVDYSCAAPTLAAVQALEERVLGRLGQAMRGQA
jgi:curved DNA-binding protein CbpA